jgi:hypothetical protein
MKRLPAREVIERTDALMAQLSTLYRGSIMNKRGRTANSNIPYSELIAQRLLHTYNFPEVIRQLPKLPKGAEIRLADHDGTLLDPTILGMEQEPRVAAALYNHHHLGQLGKVIDYSVPITVEGQSIGTIDLVSFDASSHTLYVIGYAYHERKKETVLYGALEIATLRHSLHDGRFIHAYADLLNSPDGAPIDIDHVQVRSALLYLEGSYQDRSVRALKQIPHVANLIKELDIRVFTIAVELQLRDHARFTRKQAKYPYRPVFHFVPVLRERIIHPL